MGAARRQAARPAALPVARLIAVALSLGLLGLTGGHGTSVPPLLVRVRDGGTHLPLANAQVIERAGVFRRFTNATGELLIVRADTGALRLRIRQLGYVFVDTTVTARATGEATTDTLVVALRRVAYQLGGVAVRMRRGCDSTPAPLLTAEALAQLQQGAERYLAFRETWPFEVRLTKRTALLNADGSPSRVTDDLESSWSDEWGLPYRPGRLIQAYGAGFSIPLLFVTALADTTFLNRHCFDARRIVEWQGHRVIRLSFWPDTTVDSPDWEGVALIDSATSVLRRVEFQITGLVNGHLPRRLEGYTTFVTPTSLVAFPESTFAVWWRRGPDRAGFWAPPDVAQLLHVDSLDWRKGRPPPPTAP